MCPQRWLGAATAGTAQRSGPLVMFAVPDRRGRLTDADIGSGTSVTVLSACGE